MSLPSYWRMAVVYDASCHYPTTFVLAGRLPSRCVLLIAKGLGLPISASLADTRQMIEGRLVEKGHKPQNVEVHVIESEHGFSIRLNDEGGVVLEVFINSI